MFLKSALISPTTGGHKKVSIIFQVFIIRKQDYINIYLHIHLLQLDASGDEIVGATIHFEDLQKNEVAELLKLIQPYNNKVQMLTKQSIRPSKSLETLDYRIKAPEEVSIVL